MPRLGRKHAASNPHEGLLLSFGFRVWALGYCIRPCGVWGLGALRVHQKYQRTLSPEPRIPNPLAPDMLKFHQPQIICPSLSGRKKTLKSKKRSLLCASAMRLLKPSILGPRPSSASSSLTMECSMEFCMAGFLEKLLFTLESSAALCEPLQGRTILCKQTQLLWQRVSGR